MKGSVWVFHRGALGDSVLLWPMLRALRRQRPAVTLVTDSSKGLLAQQVLGVLAVSIERARFTDLFVPDAAHTPGRIMPVGGVERVVSFLPVQGVDRTWRANAMAMFPGAAVEIVDRSLDRELAISLAEREGGLIAPARRPPEPGAPLVLHVGAGSQAKRWPMALWSELEDQIALRPGMPRRLVVAGEVEAEQFGVDERCIFERLGGRFISDLPELAGVLGGARLVVVADSGPAHLAAQLGTPTLALFGPTTPQRWSPIGPAVRVVAPVNPAAMDWLSPAIVLREIGGMLGREA